MRSSPRRRAQRGRGERRPASPGSRSRTRPATPPSRCSTSSWRSSGSGRARRRSTRAAPASCSPGGPRASSPAGPTSTETIRRLRAYAEAGADCLYAPGIRTRGRDRGGRRGCRARSRSTCWSGATSPPWPAGRRRRPPDQRRRRAGPGGLDGFHRGRPGDRRARHVHPSGAGGPPPRSMAPSETRRAARPIEGTQEGPQAPDFGTGCFNCRMGPVVRRRPPIDEISVAVDSEGNEPNPAWTSCTLPSWWRSHCFAAPSVHPGPRTRSSSRSSWSSRARPASSRPAR